MLTKPRRVCVLHRLLDGAAAWGFIAALGAAAGLAAYRVSESAGFAELTDIATSRLDLHAAGVESELAKYESLPSILELDPDVFRLLANGADSELRSRVNKWLLNLNVRAGSLSIMLADAKGTVVAASDWYEPDNPIGRTLPYVQAQSDGMRHGQARWFVSTNTNGAPQCIVARDILRASQVVGIVAVMISLESLESSWIGHAAGSQSEKVIVSDENGVVFMSSNPQWRDRALQPRPQPAARAEGGRDTSHLEPLGIEIERGLPFGMQLVRLATQGEPAGQQFLGERRTMPRPGWQVMTLSSTEGVHRNARHSALAAGGVAALLGLLVVHLRTRRRSIEQRLAAREALQRAHDELEHRVLERTAALRRANEALVGEVAERKRTEEDLRAAKDDLVQAGRLAMLGQMSAAVAHEINQPLTALRALSDNGRRQLAAGRIAHVERNLCSIADLTDRMARITAQLKSFARKAPPETSSVRPLVAVHETLELLRERIEEQQVQVRLDVPDELRVVCDRHRLEQVLINLFGNALDAMKHTPRKRLEVRAEARGDRVRFGVADSGGGLSAPVLERLFEPFFSTKPTGEGLGLGLVISSSIVREFGSDLQVRNADDGAVFEFDLRAEHRDTPCAGAEPSRVGDRQSS